MNTVLVMWRVVGITPFSWNLMKQTLDWMLMLASLIVGYSRRSSILPRKLNSVTIWSLVAWGAMLVTWITRESDSMVTSSSALITLRKQAINDSLVEVNQAIL